MAAGQSVRSFLVLNFACSDQQNNVPENDAGPGHDGVPAIDECFKVVLNCKHIESRSKPQTVGLVRLDSD